MANGRLWNGLAPSPNCMAATLRVRRTSRVPDLVHWDAGTPPLGQGTAGRGRRKPRGRGCQCPCGDHWKGRALWPPCRGRDHREKSIRQVPAGPGWFPWTEFPAAPKHGHCGILYTRPRDAEQGGSPLSAYSCECLSFLSLLPRLEAHAFNLPAPAPPPQGQFALSYPVSPPSLSSPLGWRPTLSSWKPALPTSASPYC